ncbi:tyrosyl-tRNA synthetase [Geranomyces variabilis]|uniref:tyrosine--tRNA ligase n=1 Tax=Geranomyces variabilis TaxID=109894 RepID=A0AAD5XLT1_9FUNG|nr:tyrosyl-tRNA synthetase [Geranomyces variabilis]
MSSTASPFSPIDRLQERGLVHSVTSPSLSRLLKTEKTAVYAGFDPTATSLHVGNLLQIIGLLHFQALGHQTIALVGGATGAIGDPSGKSSERVALDPDTLTANVSSIDAQLRRVFTNAHAYMSRRASLLSSSSSSASTQSSPPSLSSPADSSAALPHVKILNNLTWFENLSLLSFLSDAGRLARVSIMLARDSVRTRLDSPEGISFTEFSYQLLQAYDFWHLYRTEGCRVQIGGSDQWGNILAGMDVIRRKVGRADDARVGGEEEEAEPLAFGVTLPLVTTAKGEKFGKSEGNAIWLDPELVSPYEFYQFFRRTPDSEIQRYLQYFTMLPLSTINATMSAHSAHPGKHTPQRLLAAEVTELVHGPDAAHKAQTMSQVSFDGSLTDTRGADILAAFAGDERLVTLSRAKVVGADVVQLALACGAVKSKSSGRKLLASGGLYLNNAKIPPENRTVSDADLIDGVACVVRTGKSQQRVVAVV